ncbi:MAG: hypothetical protein J6D54_11025 [Olsenella sp.]|nr:hypothetical protein [Olsenella sp.]
MSKGEETRPRHAAQDEPREGNGAKRIAIIAIAIALVVGLVAALLVSLSLGSARGGSTSGEAPEASSPALERGSGGEGATGATGGVREASAPPEAEPTGPVRPPLVEDDSPLDAGAGANVVAATSDSGVTVTAPEGFTSTKTCQRLDALVRDFESDGTRLAFALEDLSTGRALSYKTDETFYPASAIKAPYCTMTLETYGNQAADASAGEIEACLILSDNDAYHDLAETYGHDTHASWLERFAPEAAREAPYLNYPHISAGGMLACWKETYRFGTSGEPGSALLVSCLSQTQNSALGGLLRDRYDVWAKAGWFYTYEDENGVAPATSDCGIVFSDCGAYAVAIMSDAPGDFDSIMSVVDALNAAHGKMCGGSSALLEWEGTELS